MNIEIQKTEKKEQKNDFVPGVYVNTKDKSFIVWFTEKRGGEFFGTVLSIQDAHKGREDHFQAGDSYSCWAGTLDNFELFDGKIILSN